jgi:hypothetical protein
MLTQFPLLSEHCKCIRQIDIRSSISQLPTTLENVCSTTMRWQRPRKSSEPSSILVQLSSETSFRLTNNVSASGILRVRAPISPILFFAKIVTLTHYARSREAGPSCSKPRLICPRKLRSRK